MPAFRRIVLSAAEVRSGQSYTLTAPELPNSPVEVLYALDGSVKTPFMAALDAQGQVSFQLGADTPRGEYTFLALRQPGKTGWAWTDGRLLAR